jgi:hypothetical protein
MVAADLRKWLMSRRAYARVRYWFGIIGPLIVVYIVAGLLVDLAIPNFLPRNALTVSIGDSAKAGVFAIWLYLSWRIFNTVKGIYGPDSARYLEHSPIWWILIDVAVSYFLAIFCFSVLYVYIIRRDEAAFSAALDLGDALYFSIVTMTTTGYGDIIPKSGSAKLLVSIQILFGFFYNILFFSIFAGFAGRRRQN